MNRTEQTLERYSAALRDLEAVFVDGDIELRLSEFFTKRKTDQRISTYLLDSGILKMKKRGSYSLQSPKKLKEAIEDPTIVYLAIREVKNPIPVTPVTKVSFIQRLINFFR